MILYCNSAWMAVKKGLGRGGSQEARKKAKAPRCRKSPEAKKPRSEQAEKPRIRAKPRSRSRRNQEAGKPRSRGAQNKQTKNQEQR